MQAQPCTLKLTGHVQDVDVNEELDKATISIVELNRQLITNASGDFVFDNLCTGNYTLIITHINCDTVTKKITLQKNTHVDIYLPHAQKTLGTVVVENLKVLNNIGNKKELTQRQLSETKGQSIAEALSRINGISILQTGTNISKPIIHGLHGNRILTINNGVRQEGQQWGNEHAPEIDPFIADKLTLVRGVDELKYGSDAIGGVILVEPKPLNFGKENNGQINTGYFTNQQQYVTSAQFEFGLKTKPVIKYRLQGTFKKSANVATPNYRLNNTGTEEKNFSITAAYKKHTVNSELFYSYFNNQVGIFTGSHIGNLTDLQNAIAATKPSDVFLNTNTYRIARPRQVIQHHLAKLKTTFYKANHKFIIQVSGQLNSRQEYDVVRSSTNTMPQLNLSIFTAAQDVSWETPKIKNMSSTTGLSFMQQRNSYSGRYFIPNYNAYNLGAYYIAKWSKHQWDLQAAIRYDNKLVNTRRLKFNGDTLNYDFNFATLASTFSVVYKPTAKLKLNTNLSLANRAPHVNELLSDGIHHGTATYDKGDVFLKPEKSFNLSVGANYENVKKTLSIDVLAYTKNINNFIYQQPMPDIPVLTIAGAFPLLRYTQTNALLSGLDVATLVKVHKQIDWQVKVATLFARNKMANDWLILMPANRLQNEVTYSFINYKKITQSYLSIQVENVMQQSRVPSDINGKQDYKAPPKGYSIAHLYAAATMPIFKKPVNFNIAVRNVFNTVYRNYLNSQRYFTDEMGRNISIFCKLNF